MKLCATILAMAVVLTACGGPASYAECKAACDELGVERFYPYQTLSAGENCVCGKPVCKDEGPRSAQGDAPR